MGVKDSLMVFAILSKEIIIIVGIVLGIIILFSIFVFLITPYPEPSPLLLRELAFNRACEVWNTTHDCDKNKYEEPIILYTDVNDEKERSYSIEDFCQLLKLNDKTCFKRCGCIESWEPEE